MVVDLVVLGNNEHDRRQEVASRRSLVCERWDKFHVVLVPLERRYASVGLTEKPKA